MTSNELGNLPDRELLAESRAYEKEATDNSGKLNFTAAEGAAMKVVNDKFETSLDQWDEIELEHDSKSTAKKNDRKAVLAELRKQRNVLVADTTVTEETLAKAGIPPRDKVKTAAPSPSSAPVGTIEYGKLKHTIEFYDSVSESKAVPKGMKGCEIWRYIGTTAPTSEEDFRYLATDTDSPYTAYYKMEDAGKKVWYMLRWISNRNETGEWSETIEATVNG